MWAVIGSVGQAIVVVVEITGVTDAVTIGISLLSVGVVWTVVHVVGHAVCVPVAGVAEVVRVAVLLVGVAYLGAVVVIVRHSVTVEIGAAGRASRAATVGQGLIGVGNERAVIHAIQDAVVVIIIVAGIAEIIAAVEPGLVDVVPASEIAIVVPLLRVGDGRAIVSIGGNPIAVRVANVAYSIGIGISLSRIRSVAAIIAAAA